MGSDNTGDSDPWASVFARARGEDGGADVTSSDTSESAVHARQRKRYRPGSSHTSESSSSGSNHASAESSSGSWAQHNPHVGSDAEVGKYMKRLRRWLRAPTPAQDHTASFQEPNLLARSIMAKNNGHGVANPLIRIPDFLPHDVAMGALHVIGRAPRTAWTVAKAKTDRGSKAQGAGSTQHKYYVGDGETDKADNTSSSDSDDVDGEGGTKKMMMKKKQHREPSAAQVIRGIITALKTLMRNRVGVFQAGRYTRGCYIEVHDDVASKDILDPKTRRVIPFDRDVAVIYYLTKDWKMEYGGGFLDLETSQVHPPTFNTLVAFRVPRLHSVTRMETSRPRLSIFGWFYQARRDAELERAEEKEQVRAQQRARKRLKAKKKKNKK